MQQVAQQIAKLKQHNQIKIRPAIISILLSLHIYCTSYRSHTIYAIANRSLERNYGEPGLVLRLPTACTASLGN
jgi:hypothetical protein